jgi:hypothetical protein
MRRFKIDSPHFNDEIVELRKANFFSFLTHKVDVYHNNRWLREISYGSNIFDIKLKDGSIVRIDTINFVRDHCVEVNFEKVLIVKKKTNSKGYDSLFVSFGLFLFSVYSLVTGVPAYENLLITNGTVASKEIKREKVGNSINRYGIVTLQCGGFRTQLLGSNSSLQVGDIVSAKVNYNSDKGAYDVYEMVVNGKKRKTYGGSVLFHYLFKVICPFIGSLFFFNGIVNA